MNTEYLRDNTKIKNKEKLFNIHEKYDILEHYLDNLTTI